VTTSSSASGGAALTLTYDSRGRLSDRTACTRARGTTVTVDNLFHALPVRRRSIVANKRNGLRTISRVFTEYALSSRGNVQFRLVHNGSVLMSIPALPPASQGEGEAEAEETLDQTRMRRARQVFLSVYGHKLVSGLGEWSVFDGTIGLDAVGLVSTPSAVHGASAKASGGVSGTDKLFIFERGRPLDIPSVTKAMSRVFKRFHPRLKPMGAVYITLPKGSYDINLAPDKREILLRDEKAITKCIADSYCQWLETMDQGDHGTMGSQVHSPTQARKGYETHTQARTQRSQADFLSQLASPPVPSVVRSTGVSRGQQQSTGERVPSRTGTLDQFSFLPSNTVKGVERKGGRESGRLPERERGKQAGLGSIDAFLGIKGVETDSVKGVATGEETVPESGGERERVWKRERAPLAAEATETESGLEREERERERAARQAKKRPSFAGLEALLMGAEGETVTEDDTVGEKEGKEEGETHGEGEREMGERESEDGMQVESAGAVASASPTNTGSDTVYRGLYGAQPSAEREREGEVSDAERERDAAVAEMMEYRRERQREREAVTQRLESLYGEGDSDDWEEREQEGVGERDAWSTGYKQSQGAMLFDSPEVPNTEGEREGGGSPRIDELFPTSPFGALSPSLSPRETFKGVGYLPASPTCSQSLSPSLSPSPSPRERESGMPACACHSLQALSLPLDHALAVGEEREREVGPSVTDGGTFTIERISSLRPVGQFNCSYMLAYDAGTSELYVIDQHAAEEAILFEKFYRSIPARLTVQRLIRPLPLDLSMEEGMVLEGFTSRSDTDPFRVLGFHFTRSDGRWYLTTSPALFKRVMGTDEVKEMLVSLADVDPVTERAGLAALFSVPILAKEVEREREREVERETERVAGTKTQRSHDTQSQNGEHLQETVTSKPSTLRANGVRLNVGQMRVSNCDDEGDVETEIRGENGDGSVTDKERATNDLWGLAATTRGIEPSCIRDMAAMRACKAAVKLGDRLGMHKMLDILRRLSLTSHPFHCPHGRPVIRYLAKCSSTKTDAE
ncbi:DNA mismatch repair protein Pms1/Pms2, partial [Kipferlia bialata]